MPSWLDEAYAEATQDEEGPKPIVPRSLLTRGLDALASGASTVGNILAIPRKLTIDPLARGATSLLVGKPAPVVEDGHERPPTAPELLMRAVMPERTPGGRATTADVIAGKERAPVAWTVLDTLAGSLAPIIPQALGAVGDLDAIVAKHPELAKKAHFREDLARVPVDLLANVVTDPLNALSGTAVARAVGGSAKAATLASAIDRNLARAGVALGSAGAVESGRRSIAAASEGDTDKALVELARAALSAGGAGLAHRGLREMNKAAVETKAAVDTGKAYKYDPKLLAEEQAAATAFEEASAATAKGTADRRMQQAIVEADLQGAKPWEPAAAAKVKAAFERIVRHETRAAEAAKVAEVSAREQAAGIGEGHGAAVRVGDRALTLKSAEHHMEQLPKVGQEVAGRYRAVEHDTETIAGRLQAADREALTPLGGDKPQPGVYEPVAQALDGKLDPKTLTPEQQQTFAAQRSLLDNAFREYNAARQAHGLDAIPAESNYWPRVPKGENLLDIEAQAAQRAQLRGIPLDDAMRELRGNDMILASRADRKASFEKQRTGDLADPRYDAAVIPEYINVLARRTAELRHYGPNARELQALIAQLPDTPSGALSGLKVGDREFAQRFFDRVRGVAPAGLGTQVGHLARTISGAHDLVYAALSQPLSYAQTASAAGVLPTIKGVLRTVGAEVSAPDLLRPRQLVSKMRRSIRAASIDADRVAATHRHVTDELLQATSGTGAAPTGLVGKAQRLSNRLPWIKAMLALDRGGRIAAVQTWRAAGADMIRAAQRGSLAEQRNLARLGIDWKGTNVADAAAMDLAAKHFADKTQYRSGAGALPPWASSPVGRAAFQYLSFIHAHTNTLRWMGSEALRGNLKPMARFAAVGVPIAAMSLEFRDRLRGVGWDEEDVTADNVMRKMKEAVGGKARVDPTKGPYAAAAYAARVGSVLGVGAIYQALLERAGGDIFGLVPAGKLAKSGFNAAQKSLAAAGASASAEVASPDMKPAALAAAEQAQAEAGTANAQLATALVPPVPGADIVREALAAEKPARPLLAGQVRDFLEDQRLLPVADESTRGVEGRKRVAELKRTSEAAKQDNAVLSALLTSEDKDTVASRLSKAQKSRVVAQLKLAYVRALASNDEDARQQVIRSFRALRLPFSRSTRAKLERRAIRPFDENEE